MRRSRQRHKGRTTKGLVQRRLLGVRPKSLPTRLLGWRLRAKTNYVGLVMGLAAENCAGRLIATVEGSIN